MEAQRDATLGRQLVPEVRQGLDAAVRMRNIAVREPREDEGVVLFAREHEFRRVRAIHIHGHACFGQELLRQANRAWRDVHAVNGKSHPSEWYKISARAAANDTDDTIRL